MCGTFWNTQTAGATRKGEGSFDKVMKLFLRNSEKPACHLKGKQMTTQSNLLSADSHPKHTRTAKAGPAKTRSLSLVSHVGDDPSPAAIKSMQHQVAGL